MDVAWLAMEQLEERIRHQEGIVQKLYNQLQKDGKSQNFAHVDSLSRETAIAEAKNAISKNSARTSNICFLSIFLLCSNPDPVLFKNLLRLPPN